MVRVLTVWTVAVFATLVVAATTKAGPTVFTVRPGNGIHLSDVLFALFAGGIALTVTRRVLHRGDP